MALKNMKNSAGEKQKKANDVGVKRFIKKFGEIFKGKMTSVDKSVLHKLEKEIDDIGEQLKAIDVHKLEKDHKSSGSTLIKCISKDMTPINNLLNLEGVYRISEKNQMDKEEPAKVKLISHTKMRGADDKAHKRDIQYVYIAEKFINDHLINKLNDYAKNLIKANEALDSNKDLTQYKKSKMKQVNNQAIDSINDIKKQLEIRGNDKISASGNSHVLSALMSKIENVKKSKYQDVIGKYGPKPKKAKNTPKIPMSYVNSCVDQVKNICANARVSQYVDKQIEYMKGYMEDVAKCSYANSDEIEQLRFKLSDISKDNVISEIVLSTNLKDKVGNIPQSERKKMEENNINTAYNTVKKEIGNFVNTSFLFARKEVTEDGSYLVPISEHERIQKYKAEEVNNKEVLDFKIYKSPQFSSGAVNEKRIPPKPPERISSLPKSNIPENDNTLAPQIDVVNQAPMAQSPESNVKAQQSKFNKIPRRPAPQPPQPNVSEKQFESSNRVLISKRQAPEPPQSNNNVSKASKTFEQKVYKKSVKAPVSPQYHAPPAPPLPKNGDFAAANEESPRATAANSQGKKIGMGFSNDISVRGVDEYQKMKPEFASAIVMAAERQKGKYDPALYASLENKPKIYETTDGLKGDLLKNLKKRIPVFSSNKASDPSEIEDEKNGTEQKSVKPSTFRAKLKQETINNNEDKSQTR